MKDIIYSTFLVFALVSALSSITLAVANNAVSALENLPWLTFPVFSS